jgi:uncharacterized spore protein YtfJ
MEAERLLGSLSERLGSEASIKQVYGEPIHVGGRTVVPIARVAYGFGGGIAKSGEEGGGGGGMHAWPAGALEITADGAQFIGYGAGRKLVGALLLGVAAGILLAKAMRR